jgi:SAM-dependent methyltransferase
MSTWTARTTVRSRPEELLEMLVDPDAIRRWAPVDFELDALDVISNGVINLAPDKDTVFAEAARVLRPGGRLAIADIVTEQQLTESIVCNADLWASCIGGAAQLDAYRDAIEAAGLQVDEVRENPYEFISGQARRASDKYGVKSISLRATRI